MYICSLKQFAMEIIFQLTEDGSHTLYVPALDEHYHSTHGAIQESKHVFIDAGLKPKQCVSSKLNILEIGFGTGLNAFLTLLEGDKMKTEIHYTTLEQFPLSICEVEKLNYPTLLPNVENGTELFRKLHNAPWEEESSITPYFTLLKRHVDVCQKEFLTFAHQFNLIYFDAFAPDKQPDIWSEPLFETLFSFCQPHAILTTYCAKGSVRRMIQSVGFYVERLPGPPGKREMLRAIKQQSYVDVTTPTN